MDSVHSRCLAVKFCKGFSWMDHVHSRCVRTDCTEPRLRNFACVSSFADTWFLDRDENAPMLAVVDMRVWTQS